MSDQASPWRPLSRKDDPTYDTLLDFVPAWLRPSLWAWVEPQIRFYSEHGTIQRDEDKLHEIERRLHIEFSWERGGASALTDLENYMGYAKSNGALDVVDLLASGLSPTSHRARLAELERILKEAGSAWSAVVRGDVCRLERRVDPTVAAASQKVMAESGRAGELLSKAWRAVYGREPNPSSGYRDAVRAVEAAARPVVSPTNSSATLGTMIHDLEVAPKKWDVRLSTPPGFDKIEALVNMIKLLWKAQFDRHGTPDENVPINVSNEEAETALHLATTLVQWFTRGAVARST